MPPFSISPFSPSGNKYAYLYFVEGWRLAKRPYGRFANLPRGDKGEGIFFEEKSTLGCGRLNTERDVLIFSISQLNDIETVLIPIF